eukprot:2016182-Amphidinium_carterae.1
MASNGTCSSSLSCALAARRSDRIPCAAVTSSQTSTQVSNQNLLSPYPGSSRSTTGSFCNNGVWELRTTLLIVKLVVPHLRNCTNYVIHIVPACVASICNLLPAEAVLQPLTSEAILGQCP